MDLRSLLQGPRQANRPRQVGHPIREEQLCSYHMPGHFLTSLSFTLNGNSARRGMTFQNDIDALGGFNDIQIQTQVQGDLNPHSLPLGPLLLLKLMLHGLYFLFLQWKDMGPSSWVRSRGVKKSRRQKKKVLIAACGWRER